MQLTQHLAHSKILGLAQGFAALHKEIYVIVGTNHAETIKEIHKFSLCFNVLNRSV